MTSQTLHHPAPDRPDGIASTRDFRRRMAQAAAPLQDLQPVRAALVIAAQWLTVAAACAAVAAAKWALTGNTNLLQGWGLLSVSRTVVLASVVMLGALVMLAKQHALGVILHDASHGRLFQSRRWNDLVCNWACAFPIFLSTAGYRTAHLPHHLFINTENDPTWRQFVMREQIGFPMPRRQMARLLAGDLVAIVPGGIGLLRRVLTGVRRETDAPSTLSGSDRKQMIAFWLLALGAIAWSGTAAYFVLLWLLPRVSLLVAIDRIRLFAEHDLDGHADEFQRTRIVRGTWIERQLLAPLNINFHVEHHLFPGVPLYRIPELHRLLMQQPEYRAAVHIWPSYLSGRDSLFNHLTTCKDPGVARLATE